MTTTSPVGVLTARRVRHPNGLTATVIVDLDGTELARMGGKRAMRAAAVLVSQWPNISNPDVLEPAGVWGCRADLDAARVEANRLATQTSMRTRGKYGRAGSVIPLRHAAWAVAVPVDDEVL